MKPMIKIKKWQLVRAKRSEDVLDLTGKDFITVGKRAFRGATQTTVVLPNGVSAIKAEAFAGCESLERVALSDQNSIGISCAAFRDCTHLCTIENSEQVSVIGPQAFENCIAMEQFVPGKNLRRIGDEAFRGCSALQHFTVPSKSVALGKGAFRDCTALQSVTLDAQTRALSADLFRGCRSLREITLPPALDAIPNGLLRDCTAIESITIPASVRSIGAHAFRGCTGLKAVTVELGVERIGANAFADATSLREIHLPHSVKRVGFGAFGRGKREENERISIYVDNEYMGKRMTRLLKKCGSAGCANVVVVGKTIEERKRERRRTSLDSAPTHLWDATDTESNKK